MADGGGGGGPDWVEGCTDAVVLDGLISDPDVRIVRAVAGNECTSPEVLASLVVFPDPEVQFRAARNPSTPIGSIPAGLAVEYWPDRVDLLLDGLFPDVVVAARVRSMVGDMLVPLAEALSVACLLEGRPPPMLDAGLPPG